MANPFKGEVKFDALGKTYIYKFGTYAMAVLERKAGMSTKKFFDSRGEDWGANDIVLVFFAALSQHQPKVTEIEVGDIIDDIGLDRAGDIVREGVGLAAAKQEGAAAGEADPQQGTAASVT
jgi:hypothetical protein